VAAGDLDRAQILVVQAEAAARSITDPKIQAEALTRLAMLSAITAGTAADRLIAGAFRLGSWTLPLNAVVQRQPSVLTALAAEVGIERRLSPTLTAATNF
jgi:hypothetical protein